MKTKAPPMPELAVPAGFPVGGVVLCDHIRSQDWNDRQWQPKSSS